MDIIRSMSNSDHEQPSRDTTTADQLAIDLLFKRIAERGRKMRNKQQAANEQPPDSNLTQDKQMMKQQQSEPKEQSAAERIDWIITALDNLEKAIARNDSRVIEMEIQTIRLELGNLREMIENPKK